jgi:hypothetical protein
VSFITLNLTFLLVRGFMAAVRKLNKEVVHVSSPE